jgi:hypothetical protein
MPISRLFSTQDDANAAVDELKNIGFRAELMMIVTGSAEHPATAKSVAELGIGKASAQHVAERINHGGALVIMDPPFGSAGTATPILERKRSGDTEDVRIDYHHHVAHDAAAPLSSMLNWPVLLHNPAPLSSWFKWPLLSQSQKGKDKSMGIETLSHNASPLSSTLSWPLSSRNPAPLSSMGNLRVLSDKPAPLSSWLGWKVLLNNPTPLSSRLGWRTLTKNTNETLTY